MSTRKGELIGLQVEVIASADQTQVGLRGRVVDETMKTIIIEKEGKDRMIMKKGTVFRFDTQGGIEVKGDDILFRPEERIKRAR